MIYSPEEDSYLLEKEVRKISKNKKVLDMGSGSGIQALSALASGAKSVLASDISSESLAFLRKNKIPCVKSDLFDNIHEKFDLIVFNPPYLPEDKLEDSESALATTGGKKGDEIILRFLKEAKPHLNTNGIILLLLSSLTPMDRIKKLLKSLGFNKEIISSKKLFMETLYVLKIEEKPLS